MIYKDLWKGIMVFICLSLIIITFLLVLLGSSKKVPFYGKVIELNDIDDLRIEYSEFTKDGGVLLIVERVTNYPDIEHSYDYPEQTSSVYYFILYDESGSVVWSNKLEIWKGEEVLGTTTDVDSMEIGDHFVISVRTVADYDDNAESDSSLLLLQIDKYSGKILQKGNYVIEGYTYKWDIQPFDRQWFLVTVVVPLPPVPHDYRIVSKNGDLLLERYSNYSSHTHYKGLLITKIRMVDFGIEWSTLTQSKSEDFFSYFSGRHIVVDPNSSKIIIFGVMIESKITAFTDYSGEGDSDYSDYKANVISLDPPNPIYFHVSELDARTGIVSTNQIVYQYNYLENSHGCGLCFKELIPIEIYNFAFYRLGLITTSRGFFGNIDSRLFKIEGQDIECLKTNYRFGCGVREISSLQDEGIILFTYCGIYVFDSVGNFEQSRPYKSDGFVTPLGNTIPYNFASYSSIDFVSAETEESVLYSFVVGERYSDPLTDPWKEMRDRPGHNAVVIYVQTDLRETGEMRLEQQDSYIVGDERSGPVVMKKESAEKCVLKQPEHDGEDLGNMGLKTEEFPIQLEKSGNVMGKDVEFTDIDYSNVFSEKTIK